MRRVAVVVGLPINVRNFVSISRRLLGNVIPYNLTDIGEGILKVEVLDLQVKVGDIVKQFDKICVVQSDKATVDITSRFDGVVRKVHIQKGSTALVGQPLIDIEVEGHSNSTKEVTAHADEAVSSHRDVELQHDNQKVLATPATRRVARETGIDLSKVNGTGKGGRIMKEDVLQLTVKQVGAPTTQPTASNNKTTGDRLIALCGIRKAMVTAMTEANKIPAFGVCDEIDITKLITLREQLKPLVAEKSQNKVKLSFTPFFLKAASAALLQFPELNAHTNPTCTELIVKSGHHVGFAVDTPAGLVVPNIKHVEQKSLYEVALEMSEVLERGKRGLFSVEDLRGGTFTLSNIGTIGATYTSPVINPPQVAIGAIGKLQKLPRYDSQGQVYPASIIHVSWCADHRVVDGATMVRFNNLFKRFLEEPSLMILNLK